MAADKFAEIDRLKKEYGAMLIEQQKALEKKFHKLKSKHEVALSDMTAAKKAEIDTLRKKYESPIKILSRFQSFLCKQKHKTGTKLNGLHRFRCRVNAAFKSHIANQKMTQTRLETELNKLKSKYETDMAQRKLRLGVTLPSNKNMKDENYCKRGWEEV
uniref:Uncharacterized protein n=1 Tax=Amphimedon queenslandica TaxID=400682 RepID=A0A1X7TJE6_AMPQE